MFSDTEGMLTVRVTLQYKINVSVLMLNQTTLCFLTHPGKDMTHVMQPRLEAVEEEELPCEHLSTPMMSWTAFEHFM